MINLSLKVFRFLFWFSAPADSLRRIRLTTDSQQLTTIFGTIFFVFLFFASFNVASAGVIVYDDVTTTNRTVKLKAFTKGRFFPEGGKLVEFYLDGKHIDTTLSGGDGYAFLEYSPLSPGVKNLKVKKGIDSDEGILLVTKKNDRVLLIEIESTLFVPKLRDFFRPVEGSKEALQRLSKKFWIIYLTSLIGLDRSRKWLKDNNFPLSPVLKWEGAVMLSELQERMIRLYAIIGSPDMLSEASDINSDIKKKFSFEDTEDGVVVKNWDDISKRLK